MADNTPIWGQTGWANWRDQSGVPGLPFKNDLYKWNKVNSYLYLPCAPSLPLLVETAAPAALQALANLFEPDLKEAYRIAHGPKPGRPGGNSLLKNIKGLTNAGKKSLPFLSDGETRFLFKFAEFADAAAWYLFLFGILTDFVYEWSTTAWKMAGCIKKPSYWFEGAPTFPVWTGGTDTKPGPTYWSGTGSEGDGEYDGHMIVPAGANWWAGGSAQLKPYIAQPDRKYSFAVLNNTTGEVVDLSKPQDSSTQGSNGSITMTKTQPRRQFDQSISIGWFVDSPDGWDAVPGTGYASMGYSNFSG